ncbi:MAG: GIY-YIG nuclease family protein [Algicola sp.]|nr:GIY-YIG nuclease family protein [Algicola sp.]
MNFYYVYILKCSDSSYYTGITNFIYRRFEEHQEGNYDMLQILSECRNSTHYKYKPNELT